MKYESEECALTAKRLRDCRNRKGLSHVGLEQALKKEYDIKISAAVLKNYEVAALDKFHTKAATVAGMNIKYLYTLADFYGVSTDYLLGKIDIPNPDPDDMKVYAETGLKPETVKTIIKSKKAVRYSKDGFNLLDFLITKGWLFRLCDDIYNYVTNEYAKIKRHDEYDEMIKNSLNDGQKAMIKLMDESDGIGYMQYKRMKTIEKMLEQISEEITPIFLKEYHGLDSNSILNKIAEDEDKRIIQQIKETQKEAITDGNSEKEDA